MIPEIEEKRKEIVALCKEFGVKRLDVFGSALTLEFDHENSDIDIVVGYPDGYTYGPFLDRYFELKRRLEALLEHSVDLVMVRNLRNPYFIESIEATRQPLYAA